MKKIAIFFSLILLFSVSYTQIMHVRAIYYDNPSYSIEIQWAEKNGRFPAVNYDIKADYEKDNCVNLVKSPDDSSKLGNLTIYFARLDHLKPNSVYYFKIKDVNQQSKIFWFKTLPETPERLSVVAGGDSRSRPKVRRKANIMVRKLQPDFVIFDGDFTLASTTQQWKQWFDDWDLTISDDGHIIPLVIVRGNHEEDKDLVNYFHIRKNNYYNFEIGDNYLNIIALNSETKVAGEQTQWLKNVLEKDESHWRIVSYHKPIRPHNKKKYEHHKYYCNAAYRNWSFLFYKYGVHLVLEGDTHLSKWTYPIKPDSTAANADEGFVLDTLRGTVYVGEGSWGAPLRPANKIYSWTRAAAKINQFKWIWIYPDRMEIRTVLYRNSDKVEQLKPENKFSLPKNIKLWNPSTGKVLIIKHFNKK